MSTRIYVCAYKRDDCLLKLKDPIYIPIHCGKAVFKEDPDLKGYLPELGDNTGDNISEKNWNYSEFTGTYWVWKNDDSGPDDIVGINHYRRYFAEPEPAEDTEMMTEETMKMFLEEHEFIVNGIGTDWVDKEPPAEEDIVYNGYKTNHIIHDLDVALEGVRTLYPDLFPIIEKEIKQGGAMCLNNLFIARKKHFDEYCKFMFDIFFYVEKRIDLTSDEHQGYNGRVFGFLGERLFRPWLIARGFRGIQGRGHNWEKYSGYTWT